VFERYFSLMISPVLNQYRLLSVKCSVTCTHFSPTYGEVTLLCQNFTFMCVSDNDEVREQQGELNDVHNIYIV